MLTTPCETASKYVIPAIRANVAKSLTKNKYTQKSIARILGVTQPAVSKYLSEKYEGKLKYIVNDKTIKKYADQIVEMIINGQPEENIRLSILGSSAKILKDNPNGFL
ncbi:MAG: hypothetical protein QXM68_01065 [Candidatus Aenigmatarchaeota archaeon]|nr:hypothetical protein [Candidatus Aenigmarchaeota archaeon]